jgi:hypothetical protein
VKTTEAIMEILAAYDLTQSYRDAAALVGCAPNTVARYVLARDAGGLRTTPAQRNQLMDPFRDKIEEWVDASHGRVRADVAQRKLEAMGYPGSERTTRRAVAEAKVVYRAGHRRLFRPWLPEPGLWFQLIADWVLTMSPTPDDPHQVLSRCRRRTRRMPACRADTQNAR